MNKIVRLIFSLALLPASFTNYAAPHFPNEQNKFITDNLYKNRKDYALLYFVQPGCAYCKQQLPVMNAFQQETGWYYKTIDIVQNPEVRSKFNVNGTPVIVLIKRNSGANNWQTVSIGFSELSTLREDVFKLVRVLNGQAPQGPLYVRSMNNSITPIN
ncbi:conjugal transfer protein TraF [Cronobacter turicensis]|nr:conjugal transfer protein TraF [Cronobacter turicensis]